MTRIYADDNGIWYREYDSDGNITYDSKQWFNKIFGIYEEMAQLIEFSQDDYLAVLNSVE